MSIKLRGLRSKRGRLRSRSKTNVNPKLTKQLAILRKSRVVPKKAPTKIADPLAVGLKSLALKVDNFAKHVEHNIAIISQAQRNMPDFRKLGMGIQGQVDEIRGGGGGREIAGEVPTGTPNGTLTTFTLANTPVPAASLKVYVNGVRMKNVTEYALSGLTITFVTAPPENSTVLVDYKY